MALLLWCQLTAIALLFGIAVGAQVEAIRGGLPEAVGVDLKLLLATS
jgi:hypothetical protein